MRGACYYSGMAFGRNRKTADSTTAAPEVPEAENPAATVVKPARTRRSKPTPPPAPTLDAPPLAPEIAVEDDRPAEVVRPRAPTHDEEW